MKKFTTFEIVCLGVTFILFVILLAVSVKNGHAEEYDERKDYIPAYVIATDLNCRMYPRKSSIAVTSLENGQEILLTGKWSDDKRWVEVYHSEYGKLWCDYHYLTERTDDFSIETLWDTPIKIRSQAFKGRVTGYLKKGREIEITQVVLGWGKCRQGWIDLSYCIEICE